MAAALVGPRTPGDLGVILPWLYFGLVTLLWASLRIWDDLQEWRRIRRGKGRLRP